MCFDNIIKLYKKYSMFYAVLFFVLFMTSCSVLAGFTKHGKLTKRATEAYQLGNYDAAITDAVKALRIKPDYEDAQTILMNAFPISIRNRENSIAELTSQTDLESVGKCVKEYHRLISISTSVKDLPPLINKQTKQAVSFDFKDYSKSFMKAKQVAAEAYYKEGHKLGDLGGIDNSKSAAKAFKKSQTYVHQYKDTASLYDKYRLAGIKRIAILSFINKSGKNQYGAIGELVTDQITSTIMGTPSAVEFLNIISRTELEQSLVKHNIAFSELVHDTQVIKIGKTLGLHEIIVGQITQINTSKPQTTVQNVKEKEYVVVSYKEYIDKKGKKRKSPVYGDVYGSARIFNMYANAKITGSYKIIDIKTAQLIKTDSFSGEYKYSHKWGSHISGDERGLSADTKRIITSAPGIAPSDGDRVNMAADNLVTSMSKKIIAYTE